MGSVDGEVSRGGAGGQWICRGEWQSGGAAAAFNGGVAGGPRGSGDPGAGEGWSAGGAAAAGGELGDCEAAEGAGRRATGNEFGAAEGSGAGVQGGGELEGLLR